MTQSKTTTVLVNLKWPFLAILIAGAIDYQMYDGVWRDLGSVVTFVARFVFGTMVLGTIVGVLGHYGVMNSPALRANREAMVAMRQQAKMPMWLTRDTGFTLVVALMTYLSGHTTLAMMMLGAALVFRILLSWRRKVFLQRYA